MEWPFSASVIMLILRRCQDVRERPKEAVAISLYVWTCEGDTEWSVLLTTIAISSIAHAQFAEGTFHWDSIENRIPMDRCVLEEVTYKQHVPRPKPLTAAKQLF